MATLTITKLRCVKKRDPLGKDEVDIWVGLDDAPEVFLSGPHLMDRGKNDEVVEPNTTTPVFTEKVRIRLKERNGARGGNDDLDLGTETVYPGADTGSNLFTGNNGRVAYDLNYTVTD